LSRIYSGAPATGDHQRVVVFGGDLVERGVQAEIVPWFFAVGLIAFKIVNGGSDYIASLLVRAHRVHRMANGQQRLKRHHHFIILDKVPHQHENLLSCHNQFLHFNMC
jgi:hypothetical protein